MEIYILRHGIAETGGPGQPDSQRALTAEGRDKLRRVLQRAAAAGVAPEQILSSSYRRAVETADVVVEVLGYKGKVVKTQALVPEASPHDAWEEIRSRKGESAVLLSSHEPFCSSMIAYLLNCPSLQVDMKKATLVRVDCDHFGPVPRGVLKWMITPALSTK